MFKSGDKVFCCKQGNRAVYGNYYWKRVRGDNHLPPRILYYAKLM